MFVIRRAQIQAMASARRGDLEHRIAVHVRGRFPEVCATLDDATIRRSVAFGVGRALDYGFERERDLARYVEVMYTLGPTFDADPMRPWARAVLGDASLPPAARLDVIGAALARGRDAGKASASPGLDAETHT